MTIYLLAGFGCFLTYLLVLRALRIQYVYHYIPQIADPTLFTQTGDIMAWSVIFVIVCYVRLLTYWRMRGSWKTLKSIVFVLAVFSIIAFPFLVVRLAPWFALSYLAPFLHLIYSPLKGLNRRSGFLVSCLAAVGTCLLIELASAGILLTSILGGHIQFLDFGRQILGATIHLTYAFQHYSVQFLLVLAFSWTAFPILLFTRTKTRLPATPVQFSSMGRVILVLSVLFSAAAISIRYIGDKGLYGVDTKYYLDILMSTGDLGTLLKLLPSDPRVTYILLLKSLTAFGVSPELAINIGPVILMALNSCASYMLGNEIVQDKFAGALVGMFSALGMQTSTSLYAGIYANWLAMFLAVCAFALYLRAVRTGNGLLLTLPGLLVVAFLLVHPWSGLAFSLILVFASLLDSVFLRRYGSRFVVTILVFASVIVSILTVAYVLRSHYNILGELEPLYAAFQIQNGQKLTSNLAFTTDYMVGGFISAPIFYLAGLLGCVFLYKSHGSSIGSRLLFAWLVVTSIPLLFAEQWIQWRLIYLMPMQVLCGLGVYYVSSLIISPRTRVKVILVSALLCTVLLTLLNYMLSSVNFLPSL